MWLAVVAQAQLYIFHCVDVSQLPQFKSVASDTASESSQVPGKGIQVDGTCRRTGLSDREYFRSPLTLSFFLIPQRERERERDLLSYVKALYTSPMAAPSGL